MAHSLDHLLPSLQAMGAWTYWFVGLASLLEAFFLTGLIVPGTLIVDAAGILAQRGYVGFFDLVWFVAIGSILGGELSFWAGRLGKDKLFALYDPRESRTFQRAQRLFERRGGLALVIGRFLGPVAGFVPLAGALAGMSVRRFRIWNAVGSVPYALAHLAMGYFFGDLLTRAGPMTTRTMLFVGAAAVLLAVLIYLALRIERYLPAILATLGAGLDRLGETSRVRAWRGRHPRLAGFLAGRLDRARFTGLPATLIGLLFLYVLGVYLSTVFDVLMVPSVVRMDKNVASLMRLFREPLLIHLAAYVTAFGIWQAVSIVLLAAVAALLLTGRWTLAAGLLTSVAGNIVTVAVLKLVFHRARPELAYFVEKSGSFPSGHAAISVACYGMLAYIGWRARLFGPIAATLLALIAAFLLGLSRLYLIEHYLSDVLNGYLVGTMWLLIGVSVAEWLQSRAGVADPVPAPRPRRIAAAAILAVALAGCGMVSAGYHKALTPPRPDVAARPLTDMSAFFETTKAPAMVERLDGTDLAPINVVLLAKDRSALTRALARADLSPAAAPSLSNMLHALLSDILGRPDRLAPSMPAFWNGTPNAMAYVVPAKAGAASETEADGRRDLLRIWPTRWTGPGGLQVFVGSATLDAAQPWDADERRDPHPDAERDALVRVLGAAGVVAAQGLTTPGKAADPHAAQGDGSASVITLR